MSTLPPLSGVPHVIVAGAGSGGLAAALAACEAGATVSVYEAGEQCDVGGNARYSGGLFLFAHDGSPDVLHATFYDPAAATVALEPVRNRLLSELATPASAAMFTAA